MLTVHLLHETAQDSSSFWHPYIAQLPREYSLMMNFAPAHIQALQMPYARQLTEAACDHSKQQWDGAKQVIANLGTAQVICCQGDYLCLALHIHATLDSLYLHNSSHLLIICTLQCHSNLHSNAELGTPFTSLPTPIATCLYWPAMEHIQHALPRHQHYHVMYYDTLFLQFFNKQWYLLL